MVSALVTGEDLTGLYGAVFLAVGVVGMVLSFFGRSTGLLRSRSLLSREALPGLTSQQRSAVDRAVQRGEAPPDPALVEATIRRAQEVQDRARTRWAWAVLGSFAALFWLVAAAKAIAGSLEVRDVVTAGMFLIVLPGLWWTSRHSAERARQAEAAAVRGMTAGEERP